MNYEATNLKIKALIDGYLAGNDSDGAQLIQRFGGVILNDCLRYFNNSTEIGLAWDISDMTQTAIERILRALHTYEKSADVCSFTTLLRQQTQIACSKFVIYSKAKKRIGLIRELS